MNKLLITVTALLVSLAAVAASQPLTYQGYPISSRACQKMWNYFQNIMWKDSEDKIHFGEARELEVDKDGRQILAYGKIYQVIGTVSKYDQQGAHIKCEVEYPWQSSTRKAYFFLSVKNYKALDIDKGVVKAALLVTAKNPWWGCAKAKPLFPVSEKDFKAYLASGKSLYRIVKKEKYPAVVEPCPGCQGKGKVSRGRTRMGTKRCPSCSGAGTIEKRPAVYEYQKVEVLHPKKKQLAAKK